MAGAAVAGAAAAGWAGEGVGGSVGSVGTGWAALGLGLGSKAVLRLLSPCSLPLAGLPSSVGIGTAATGAGGAAGLGGIDAFGDGEAIGLAVGLTLLRVLKSSSTNSFDAKFGAFGSSLVLVSDVAVVARLSLGIRLSAGLGRVLEAVSAVSGQAGRRWGWD